MLSFLHISKPTETLKKLCLFKGVVFLGIWLLDMVSAFPYILPIVFFFFVFCFVFFFFFSFLLGYTAGPPLWRAPGCEERGSSPQALAIAPCDAHSRSPPTEIRKRRMSSPTQASGRLQRLYDSQPNKIKQLQATQAAEDSPEL